MDQHATCLMKLCKPGNPSFSCFTVTADGSMILASGGGTISVWGLGSQASTGKTISEGSEESRDDCDHPPLVEYQSKDLLGLCIDPYSEDAWFLNVSKNARTVIMWTLTVSTL